MSNYTCNEYPSAINLDVKNDSESEIKVESEDVDKQHHIVRICEVENNREHARRSQNNSLLNRVEFVKSNLDESVKNESVHHVYFGGNKEGKMPVYWVQFSMTGGRNIPPGGGPPLVYEPDRNEFVRLVFSIVLFMLILTAGFVAFVYMTPNVRNMFRTYGIFLLVAGMLGMLGLNYAMMCSACTRTPPCNFICLFLTVSFMSLITAVVTARYRTELILLALLATTITVAVCLGLACTKFDFTKYLLYFIVIATAFSALAFLVSITMFVMKIRCDPVRIVILVVGTLINVVMLIMELQMILGGRAVELSEDDYALGAFMLYTSIIDLFLKLLQLLGIFDKD